MFVVDFRQHGSRERGRYCEHQGRAFQSLQQSRLFVCISARIVFFRDMASVQTILQLSIGEMIQWSLSRKVHKLEADSHGSGGNCTFEAIVLGYLRFSVHVKAFKN